MENPPSLIDIHGIGVVTANVLRTNGIKTPEDVARATVKQLAEIPGFSPLKAAEIIKSATALLKDTTTEKTKAKKGGAGKKTEVKKGKKMAKKQKKESKKTGKKNKDKKGKKKNKGKKKKKGKNKN